MGHPQDKDYIREEKNDIGFMEKIILKMPLLRNLIRPKIVKHYYRKITILPNDEGNLEFTLPFSAEFESSAPIKAWILTAIVALATIGGLVSLIDFILN